MPRNNKGSTLLSKTEASSKCTVKQTSPWKAPWRGCLAGCALTPLRGRCGTAGVGADDLQVFPLFCSSQELGQSQADTRAAGLRTPGSVHYRTEWLGWRGKKRERQGELAGELLEAQDERSPCGCDGRKALLSTVDWHCRHCSSLNGSI